MRTIATLLMMTSVAGAQMQMGFYCGQGILYPYPAVYCPQENCLGDCRSVFLFMSKSAPLPATERLCTAAVDQHHWYQWTPRMVASERQKYIGPQICVFEDRGAPKEADALER